MHDFIQAASYHSSFDPVKTKLLANSNTVSDSESLNHSDAKLCGATTFVDQIYQLIHNSKYGNMGCCRKDKRSICCNNRSNKGGKLHISALLI